MDAAKGNPLLGSALGFPTVSAGASCRAFVPSLARAFIRAAVVLVASLAVGPAPPSEARFADAHGLVGACVVLAHGRVITVVGGGRRAYAPCAVVVSLPGRPRLCAPLGVVIGIVIGAVVGVLVTGGIVIILGIIHRQCERRLVNSRASGHFRCVRRPPPRALMGIVIGFVSVGKRHPPLWRRRQRNRCRFFVARALGRHCHAHEHRGEGRCLVVAPGGTVSVPDPWGLRFPPPAWAVRLVFVAVPSPVGPNNSVDAWGPGKNRQRFRPVLSPGFFRRSVRQHLASKQLRQHLRAPHPPPPAWALRWVFMVVAAPWAGLSRPLSSSLSDSSPPRALVASSTP